ncbi:LysR family transcriptional regulator [Nocardia sp. NEAU-G5]|uniref:LysR family transcriptional regulator n=1 Tax=Nocardia albiluteola TaxID=2842303 RepID=A0ABS6AVJ6_9NOCA|nr:LysR family transcriptional regulator [Nocardia albiluteola]MBU3061560.1 LysR family transcriptional regulator [Nocardia albiluteola]
MVENSDTDRIDPVELQAFLVLAEELHFGRTAARLGLSQPRVSQLIRTLERRIGRQLFHRTSRRVTLNAFGEQLLAGVRPAFADLRRAIIDTRRAARGVRVGFLGPYASALDTGMARFRARHPDCTITRIQVPWIDILGPLRRGEVDVQVCLAPIQQPDMMIGPVLATYPRMLAVARTHPLAGRGSADLEDLAELPVIGPDPAVTPEFAREFWPPETTPSGRPIRRGPQARTEPEMLSAVAHGDGVFLTTAAMPSHFAHPGVMFVPFTGMPDARAILIWLSSNDYPKIAELAELATG